MRKFLLALLFCCFHLLYAQLPQDFVIPAKVTANEAVSSITIQWPANSDAISYTIKRKTVTDSSYKAPFFTISSILQDAATATQFTDTDISPGTLYEYEISGNFSTTLPSKKSIYLCAGIHISPVHKRGSLVLLCEKSVAPALASELSTLYNDLVGDGWNVIRYDVTGPAEEGTVALAKAKIRDAYNSYPDLKQVLIVGHVPVPYSGNIDPDGHTNHNGCWPADGYYGDLVSNWTDTITGYFVASTRAENRNLPGDGKFDQDNLQKVQLAVGRIDFANMPAFVISETELLRRYLNKNHLFRTGAIQINRQALVEDNFPTFAEKFSQSAWKSYAATVGYDNVLTGQYETDLQSSVGYLWSFGTGGGVYTGASGLCSTGDFVTSTYKTIFTQLFGSYFGDWDTQDNFMKASLASPGNTLTCVWGGRPHWFFHHMSTGSPIGYSALVTMNNKGMYTNTGNDNGKVHIGLMGDPSLRSSYIKPAKNISIVSDSTKINLAWNASDEVNIAGYYVYRSTSVNGNFTLLTETPVTDTAFTDNAPANGNNIYMVRSVRIDTVVTLGNYTNSSTYFNMGAGIFDSVIFTKRVRAPLIFLNLIDQRMLTAAPKQVVIQGSISKRYFAGEKKGVVELIDNNFNLTGTYLNIENYEDGFFSMVFHPDFKENKLLYVLYTRPDGNLELARYKENADGITASLSGIMFNTPIPAGSKNLGGEMHFGPDGYLYISTGDGDTKDAALNNAQKKNLLLGKMLRIDVNTSDTPPYYSIPADNPYGNEVYATGLRFPYRWDFDRQTNEVWIADRGDSSIEEINHITLDSLKGANFGWGCYEGSGIVNPGSCSGSGNYKFPVFQYPSPGNGGAVTGGTVYRGETFPALRGYYIFADSETGIVYLSKYDSLTNTFDTSSQLLSPAGISDISEDSNGELHATSLLGGVYRIESDGPRAYRFLGNGNWDDPENWSGKIIPPSILPPGSEIIISPAQDGECILNVQQTISAGSKLIVENNQHLMIPGDLLIQQ